MDSGRRNRMGTDFDYGGVCVGATYPHSPTGPDMGNYMVNGTTVITYQTHIERQGRGGHSLPWQTGVPAHCKWPQEDREEEVQSLRSLKGVGKSELGGQQIYIPDQTLAQLTVKELNKRVGW